MSRARRRIATLAAAGLVLAACSSASSATTSPTEPSTSASTTTTSTMPGQQASAGCASRTALTPGVTSHTEMLAGAEHSYLLEAPAGLHAGQPAPMVMLFHGWSGDAVQIEQLTHMGAEASKRGEIVVEPDGPGHTWQASGTGTDAVWVDALLTTLTKRMCVDTHRVFATGFSAGAAFTIAYACAHQSRIAAIATVEVEFQLGCSEPISILAFHGTNDPAVPYQNGAMGASLPGVKVRGTLLNMGDWAKLDACGGSPTTTQPRSEISHSVWPGCTAGTSVELYTVVGGSHTWPGADPKLSPLYTTQQIDATGLILDFFSPHHLG